MLDHGRVIEKGPAATLLAAGRQPLTRALLDPGAAAHLEGNERVGGAR